MIKAYLGPHKPNLSGLWNFHALVRGDGGCEREMLKEFTILVDHKGSKITAKLVNGAFFFCFFFFFFSCDFFLGAE
jgi:hypothetical protein